MRKFINCFGLATLLGLFSACLHASSPIQLTAQNTLNFNEPVTDQYVSNRMVELQRLLDLRGNKPYPIYIVLNSPGGSVSAGLDFIEFVKTQRNVKTITIFAASMAYFIAQLLPGERLITAHGVFMAHRASLSFRLAEAEKIESALVLHKKIIQQIENRVAERIKMPLDEYKQRIVDEWWLDAMHALHYKTADAQVDIQCSSELVHKTSTSTVPSMFGNVTVRRSECPLIGSL